MSTLRRSSEDAGTPIGGAADAPADRDGFIGRTAEKAHVVGLLLESRLVTVSGPPGVGKTRLASEVIREGLTLSRGQAHWVDLAPVSEGSQVVATIAAGLGVHEQPARPISESVLGHLCSRPFLLALDNCEHVLDACAEFVRRVLDECADVTVLTTSQAPLGVDEELVWTLDPLGAADGCQLFCSRARAVNPAFALTPSTAALVEEICCRLDGIPLAIELAAARADIYTPSDIAELLDDRFRLPPARHATDPGRHRTLENALDWSYALLTTAEQAVFRRLSVFSGGATFRAARAVVGADAEALANLVDRSLLVSRASGGQSRFLMLETIRSYAAARLSTSGEEDEARRRHGYWFIALAEAAGPHLTGAKQHSVLERLDVEYENLRSAFSWATSQRAEPDALRLAGALALYWRMRGRFSEGREWLGAALAVAAPSPPAILGRAEWASGFMALMREDVASAVPLIEESRELFRQVSDRSGEARAILLLGNCRLQADAESALELLESSVAIARRANDKWCLAHALALAGQCRLDLGQSTEAEVLLEEAVAVALGAQDRQGLRIGLLLLGRVLFSRGELDLAERRLRDALRVTHELGEAYGIAIALRLLGEIAAARDQPERAESLLLQALRFSSQIGADWATVSILSSLGSSARSVGDLEAAERWFDEAALLSADAGLDRTLSLRGRARVAVDTGELDEAEILLAKALAEAETAGRRKEMTDILIEQADLARRHGQSSDATEPIHRALELSLDVGNEPAVAKCLETVADLAIDACQWDRAARLIGAAGAIRSRRHWRPPNRRGRDREVRLGSEMSPTQLADALDRGSSMSTDQAVAYALRGGGRRNRPDRGWESLTRTEREVVRLVAAGLSNPEIGSRLYISRNTVKRHLSRVFPKLGVTSRVELAAVALREDSAGARLASS